MKALKLALALALAISDGVAAYAAASAPRGRSLRPVQPFGLLEEAAAAAPRPGVELSFKGLRGANVLHGAYWLPDSQTASFLFENARRMNVNVLRIPIPMSLVISRTRYTEQGLLDGVREVLDAAAAERLKVILVMDGYTPYAGKCGYKVGFVEVAPLARRIVRELRRHPALYAWDLLNEPLSGADGMGCDKSIHGSVIRAVRAMKALIREEDPRTPVTVGEAYPEYQSTWNEVADFHSPHIYSPFVKSPVTEEQLARLKHELAVHLARLRRELTGPIVIGEFGFDPLSQVNDEDQARAFRAYYEVLRERDLGSLFWQLAVNDYTVLNADGSWRPAAFAIRDQHARNAAQFVRQTPPPATMRPGESAEVSVTFRNAGQSRWSEASLFPIRLGAQAPQDNTIWLARDNRVRIDGAAGPGEEYTFRWSVTAPAEPGDYPFQWQLVQDGVEWFGPSTPLQRIRVDGPRPAGVETWECQADGRWYSDGRCYAQDETCNPAGPRRDASSACRPGQWKETPCGC